jgi:hypothetical protein
MKREPKSRKAFESRKKRKSVSPGKKEIATPLDWQDWDLARLRELYYWSSEPGFLDIIRTLAAMPESGRAAVEAFVSMAHDASSIIASIDPAGRLTMTSPQVAQAIAIAQHCADYDDNGTPPRLH